MKTLRLLSLAALFLITSSLTTKKTYPLTPGTYGVGCGTDAAANSQPMIALTFNADNTFRYIDNSNPAQKLNISGTWALKNGHIELSNYPAQWSIHHTWSVDKNQQGIKSRNKLNWRRLCLLQAANKK